MTSPLIRYELDPTGTNPDNSVVNEAHTLSTTQIRSMVPTYGPFFSDSLQVYDVGTGALLVKGTQYQCVELLQEPTLKYGKEICQVVLITDPLVSGSVKVNYQVLGGLYQFDMSGVVSLYDSFLKDNRAVDWMSILNKPTEYPPMMHNHILNDVYGFEYIVVALERIRNAIILSDLPALEAIIDWVKGMIITPAEVTAGAPIKKLVTFDVLLDYIRDVVIPDAVAAANVAAGAGGGTSGISLKDVTDYLDTIYVSSAEITAGAPVPKIVQHDKLIEFLNVNKVTTAEITANVSVDKVVTFDKLLAWKAAQTGQSGTIDNLAKNTAVSSDAGYGSAIAVSKDGSRLVVGAPNSVIFGKRRGMVYVFAWSGGTWVEEDRLVASNAFEGDQFGYSVDINADGTRIIIGAPYADYGASWDTGGFYIFRRLVNTTSWDQELFITGGSGGPQDTTGTAVAISDDGQTIAVGSKDDESTDGTSAGSFMVFYMAGSGTAGTWKGLTLADRHIVVPINQSQVYFGSCVDMDASGSRYICGGWGYEKTAKEYGTGSGIAAIYTASGGTFIRETWLYPNTQDYVKNGEFGWDVAMNADGSRAVVSSLMGTSGSDNFSGAVFVFVRNNTTWTQEGKLVPDVVRKYSGYGYSVTINDAGDKILVGTVDELVNGNNTGVAYVFTRDQSNVWTQADKLKGNDGLSGDNFGSDVAMNSTGELMVVGAQFASVGGVSGSGKVYTFGNQPSGPALSETIILTASPSIANGKFGSSVAISADGKHMVVGSPFAPYLGKTSGVIGIFDLDSTGAWKYNQINYSSDAATGDIYGCSVAISADGSIIAVGAYGAPAGTPADGHVYVLKRDSAGSYQQQNILKAIGSTWLGFSLDISDDGQTIIAGAPNTVSKKGMAYIFNMGATDWTSNYTYVEIGNNSATEDYYGYSVSINAAGDKAVVGAIGKDVSGIQSCGSAVIWSKVSTTTWSLLTPTALVASDKKAASNFGFSVAMNALGNIVIIGAYQADAPGKSNTGAAYIYEQNSLTPAVWVEKAKLVPSILDSDCNYGCCVAINAAGDKVIVGALDTDLPGGYTIGGAAYVHAYDAVKGSWNTTPITASNKAANMNFGVAVACDSTGNVIAVGARGAKNTPALTNAGAVYVYS